MLVKFGGRMLIFCSSRNERMVLGAVFTKLFFVVSSLRLHYRTKLTLESETEEQAQALQDFKLEKEYERAAKNQQMEKEKLLHKQMMQNMHHEQQLAHSAQTHEQKMKHERDMQELEQDSNLALKVCNPFKGTYLLTESRM